MSVHPLAGHLSVDESARRIRHYRYAEERMMRILGGWIALTPELPAKLLFGRHVWDCAQHADLWGRRLPELRAHAQQSEPAGPGVVRFIDLLEDAEGPRDTKRRLTGLYRVLKPHLAALYQGHLDSTNVVYEPPTRRILERCLEEERRHVAAGAVVFRDLFGAGDAESEAWEARLLGVLAEAGGVTGDTGAPPRIPVPTSIEPAAVAPDLVPLPRPFADDSLPADLAPVVASHAAALAAGDRPGIEAGVATSAREAVLAEYQRLGAPWADTSVVALAAIGPAYRIVKLAFMRPGRTAVLQLRWKCSDGVWRVVAAELVRDEPHLE
jgi:hypothetical protein